jgi:two-component sensor histidine kinase
MIYIIFILLSLLIIGIISYYKLLKYTNKLFLELDKTREEVLTLNNKVKKHTSFELICKNEIQHRVRNNLQQIISILSILYLKNGMEASEDLIYHKFYARINVLILVQESFFYKKKNNFVNFTEKITKQISQNENYHKKIFKVYISCNEVKLSLDNATYLGMIIYELTANSYQFTTSSNFIEISLNEILDNQYELLFNDFGEGYNFKQKSKNGIGHELVDLLVLQLKGKIINNTKSKQGLKIIFNN